MAQYVKLFIGVSPDSARLEDELEDRINDWLVKNEKRACLLRTQLAMSEDDLGRAVAVLLTYKACLSA